MCDYSLHAVNNRLAKEGESLVIHKFHTGSKGLASLTDLEPIQPKGLIGLVRHRLFPERYWDAERRIPAVCVPPGARLRLTDIPKPLREKFGVGAAEDVTFTQLTHEPFRYRDAVRFGNGETVIMQMFDEGVRVEVLALTLEEAVEAEAEAEEPTPANLIKRGMSANA